MSISTHVRTLEISNVKRLSGAPDYQFEQLRSAYQLKKGEVISGVLRPADAAALIALSASSRSSIDPQLLMPHIVAFGIGAEVELATNPDNWMWGSASGNHGGFFSELYSALGTSRCALVAKHLGFQTKRRIRTIALYDDIGLQVFSEDEVPISGSNSPPTFWVDVAEIAATIRSALGDGIFTAYPKASYPPAGLREERADW